MAGTSRPSTSLLWCISSAPLQVGAHHGVLQLVMCQVVQLQLASMITYCHTCHRLQAGCSRSCTGGCLGRATRQPCLILTWKLNTALMSASSELVSQAAPQGRPLASPCPPFTHHAPSCPILAANVHYITGRAFGAWVRESGLQAGEQIRMKNEGGRVLIQRVTSDKKASNMYFSQLIESWACTSARFTACPLS
jgi:hypothetical protein